ncbi:reverse transcriptase domain-containing protein [Tanacetum coccineum]
MIADLEVFSLEGAARIWLEKEPPRSILTWDDLVSKFINKFFPPSKTTNLRNEITRFQQKFDETFYEAWDRFNDLLRGCPHHGFSELHQLDTFCNALNSNDQDSLNSAACGNFLDKMPRECLKIIESKSKVCQSRSKAIVSKVSTNSSTPAVSSDVAELKDMVRALILDKKNQTPAPAPVLMHRQAAAVNYNQGNANYQPQMVANQIRPPGSDFLIEEIDAFLEHDDSIPPGVDGIYDSEGDTVYLEELLSVINNKNSKGDADTNLVLNWEKKCHFMVKEGIVLGHKISKSGIEVDKAKVDVIAKLPHPTTVKGIRSFLGHAGFYR